MRKNKILISIGALLIVALIVVCCISIPRVIYQSEGVKVTQVSVRKDRTCASFEWLAMSEEQIYRTHTVILSGVVKNVREARVNYTVGNTAKAEYITLFDIEVSDCLSNSSYTFKKSDIITVGYGISSYNYAEGVPVVEQGKEFLLFCTVPSEQSYEDPLCLAEYVDCWVFAPYQLMLEKVEDQYIMTEFWGQILKDDQKITEQENVKPAVYSVLKERTQNGSGEYNNLVSTGYTVECETLEQIIENAAIEYWQGGT